MVYRIFVEKKEGLDNEARGLLAEGRNLLRETEKVTTYYPEKADMLEESYAKLLEEHR